MLRHWFPGQRDIDEFFVLVRELGALELSCVRASAAGVARSDTSPVRRADMRHRAGRVLRRVRLTRHCVGSAMMRGSAAGVPGSTITTYPGFLPTSGRRARRVRYRPSRRRDSLRSRSAASALRQRRAGFAGRVSNVERRGLLPNRSSANVRNAVLASIDMKSCERRECFRRGPCRRSGAGADVEQGFRQKIGPNLAQRVQACSDGGVGRGHPRQRVSERIGLGADCRRAAAAAIGFRYPRRTHRGVAARQAVLFCFKRGLQFSGKGGEDYRGVSRHPREGGDP